MKRLITTQMLLAIGMMATAQVKTPVTEFNLAGPYAVSAPFAIDTVDVQGKKFDPVSQLGSIALTSHFTGKFSGQVLPSLPDSKSVGLLSFYVNNSDFIKGKIEVKGPKHSKLFIDGVEAGGELKLAPEHHTFTIQYLAEPKDTDSVQVVFDTPTSITYQLTPNHPYMVHDLTDGKRVRGINLSADGQFVCVSYQTTDRGGNTRWNYELRDVSRILIYRDNKNVEKELTYTRDYWRNKVNVNFHTQDKAFDQFMQWIAFQPLLRRVYGCSFLPYHDYGRGGRGWRDLWQDCLSLLFMEPGEVRNMIVANFGGVRMDGTNATIIGEGLGNFIADRNGIARVWMDHAFWPLRTLLLYIEQSGDYDILIEQVPYFKDSIVHRGNLIDKKFENAENKQLVNSDNKEMVYEGTILEHLLIQNLTSYYEVGEHNVLRLRGADWNDALDMANENGESVAFSYAYAGNLRELAKLIRKFSARCKVNAIFVASEIAALLDHAQTTEEKTRLLAAYMKTVEGNLCGEQIAIELSELANKE